MSFTIFSSLCVQLPSIVWLITRRHYEQWWISPKENPFIVLVFLFMQWTSFKSLRRKPTICSLIIIYWRENRAYLVSTLVLDSLTIEVPCDLWLGHPCELAGEPWGSGFGIFMVERFFQNNWFCCNGQKWISRHNENGEGKVNNRKQCNKQCNKLNILLLL